MFTAFSCFIIVVMVEVFAVYSEDKISPDAFLEYFGINAFVYGNDSIRFNITWNNDFISNSILDVIVENDDTDSDCFYPLENTYDLNNHTIIIPSLNISNPVDNILLGCSYDINITLKGQILNHNYHVPDCVENFCSCVTNDTNLIKLLSVTNVEDDIYRVKYTSYNTSIEKGNFYITEIFYYADNADHTFMIPEHRYKKGEFEIRMEYLNNGENYTLFVHYKDFDNINPDCDYRTYISFTAQIPPKSDNHIFNKIVVIISLLLFFSLLICLFLKWSKYFVKTAEELKKCLFPPVDENLQITGNLATSFKCMHHEINTLYTPLELSNSNKSDIYEFPRERITFKGVIGVGAFGVVYYAKAHELNGLPGYTMVAVKLLRADAPKDELTDFQAEIKMLKKIGVHKNIVKLLACVTKTQPYMMVMELVSSGDLKEYLLKLREIWIKNRDRRLFFPEDMEDKITKPGTKSIEREDSKEAPLISSSTIHTSDSNPSKSLLSEGITSFDVDSQTPLLSDVGGLPDPVLDHTELENFALQIASGMAHLEKIPVTHRDLAARNILITKEKTLKISDFGMSRTGPYVIRNTKKIPLRWMAIEAIENFKTDSKSDVWSFGVVLWEIGTLGALPYEKVPNELIVEELKSGKRLPRPEICTDELYALMQRCWMENPKDRPSFQELVDHFNVKKKHVYVDFSQINPKYVFPPTDPKC